ncbi:hypothetical protein K3M35_16925 [Rhodococcus sp. DMU2021]|uniref:hypothetical protein n=1 Tax=Rhodococcus sp. DMU2021 TaxID=2866997 RepID=UPI001C7CB188|nr:hypothetical protein [Rhodococcus sp. DMU2021]MBX4170321.1 hypothetical protein [Rhodococcus sp. DMU2021]
MSAIEPYASKFRSSTLSATGDRLARRTAHELAAIEHAAQVRTAVVASAGEIQQAKIDAVAQTGAYAMQQAALVAQVQQQLALAAPAAAGDLDFLKTMTVMGIGQIVADTCRAVNQ